MVLIYLCREGRESMERCEMCDDLYIYHHLMCTLVGFRDNNGVKESNMTPQMLL